MQGNTSQPADSAKRPDATPVGCWFVPMIFVIMFGVGWGWWSSQPAIISSAWANYEPVFHDNLLTNVRQGFQLDFSNDLWLVKFGQLNSVGQYSWMYAYNANGDTAAHFPGVPYLMAAGDYVSGQQSIIGGFASFLLAFALAWLINTVRLQFGWAACGIATVVLISDGVIFQASGFQSGDTLVAALVALAFVGFIHGVGSAHLSRRSIWPWPFAGAMLGATTLFQPATNFWLLAILSIWLGSSAYDLIRRRTLRIPAEACALFWIGVFVVAAPWWIRNCKVTGDFKPLGNTIGMNLVGAYCDESMHNGGNLDVNKIVKMREIQLIAASFHDAELIEKEAYLDEFGFSTASQWALDHAAEVPQLVTGRIANHFGFGQLQSVERLIFNAVILLGALIGCLLCWRRWGGVILTLVAISTLVTAATWSDSGRQLIPLRALIDVAFAIGVVSLFSVIRQRPRSKPTRSVSNG